MVEVRCPSCRRVHQLPEAFAGKKGRCKECGGSFRVPALESPPAAESTGDGDGAAREEDRVGAAPLIVGGALLLLLAIGALFLVSSGQRAPAPSPAGTPPSRVSNVPVRVPASAPASSAPAHPAAAPPSGDPVRSPVAPPVASSPPAEAGTDGAAARAQSWIDAVIARDAAALVPLLDRSSRKHLAEMAGLLSERVFDPVGPGDEAERPADVAAELGRHHGWELAGAGTRTGRVVADEGRVCVEVVRAGGGSTWLVLVHEEGSWRIAYARGRITVPDTVLGELALPTKARDAAREQGRRGVPPPPSPSPPAVGARDTWTVGSLTFSVGNAHGRWSRDRNFERAGFLSLVLLESQGAKDVNGYGGTLTVSDQGAGPDAGALRVMTERMAKGRPVRSSVPPCTREGVEGLEFDAEEGSKVRLFTLMVGTGQVLVVTVVLPGTDTGDDLGLLLDTLARQ